MNKMKHPIFTRRRWLFVFGIGCLILINTFLCLLFLCATMMQMAMLSSSEQKADSILYHTNEDLKKITGVDFPEVVVADSLFYVDGMVNNFYQVKMILLQKKRYVLFPSFGKCLSS